MGYFMKYVIIHLFVVVILCPSYCQTFRLSTDKMARGNSITMNWSFGKGMGSLSDLGVVGAEGEYYFHPQKPVQLKGPPGTVGKARTIPIFIHSNVLVPGSLDWLNIFEMKSRQLLSDVQDGTFGVSYYSQSQQKIALVGTLAKVKSKKILDDGRTLAVIECLDRFYVEEVTSETPYLKARVRPFKDYSETPTVLDDLERKVFDDVRCNFKFMKLLLPQKNYTMSSGLLLNRPPSSDPGTRIINLASQSVEKERRAKFSYAVLEMLQISNPTKLSLLQEHISERKLAKYLTILGRGDSFLREELVKRGIATEPEIQLLREAVLRDRQCLDIMPQASWLPENYINGQWVQRPTFFDEVV